MTSAPVVPPFLVTCRQWTQAMSEALMSIPIRFARSSTTDTCCIFSLLLLQTLDLHILLPCTVEPCYNEVLGTMKITFIVISGFLLYQEKK